ncbi:MAG TPA: molybdopterin-dependent oxidoreductase [Thermoplasmata archaeon]|nr:molybdopterin-dependent oxidoreductase [Thermoplasmata archaeon]
MNVTRRDLLKGGASAGALAVFGLGYGPVLLRTLGGPSGTPTPPDPVVGPEGYLHSSCLQCNTGCGIKVKVVDGEAIKIEGSPYTPFNRLTPLGYAKTPAEAVNEFGALCPKGQAGLQTAYDPYRLRMVLKRAGPRGSNKWITVPFDQAIQEIVDGGALFASVPGEEGRQVPGLKDLWALRDAQLMKDMAADVKLVQKGTMTLADFKTKYAANLDKLIDPDHPDLGPRNNQVTFVWGRLKAGRREFIDFFIKDGLGSANYHGHTTVCQGSLYFAAKAMSDQFADGKWQKGQKFYWQADLAGAEFVIFVGANPFEGNYGITNRSLRIAEGLADGRLKYAVVDPRMSKAVASSWKWLPIKPGTEAGLAMGMTRWILENSRHDARFLANANKAAATADSESTWTNSAWLAKIRTDGTPGAFLRGSDIGVPTEQRTGSDGNPYTHDAFVVLDPVLGTPTAFDPNDTATAVEGNLLVDTTVSGIRVKSVVQLLLDAASEKTLAEWAALCGLAEQDIVDLAREFTSHGKKAAADIHRGVSQHTNGFYNVLSWFTLNLLIGNYDWKGGMAKATTYGHAGGKTGQPYDFAKMRPGKLAPFGITLIRHEMKVEDTTLFNKADPAGNYPTKRPWFPFSSDIYQEIVPSIGDEYPYPMKAMFLYMGTPVYSLPAGHTNIAILRDTAKLPLFVCIDITVGETSMYADYIFPDLSFLERWEFQGSHPNVLEKIQPVRQPVIPPMTETVTVFGEPMPISLESMILAFGEKMGLPGFGTDGLGAGLPLRRPEDVYLKMVANVASGDGPATDWVPEAPDEEMAVFEAARSHLPSTVYDPAEWASAAGAEWWKRAVYVLNRGGRFASTAYDGEKLKNKWNTFIGMYMEKYATSKNSMTGAYYGGMARSYPIADSLGRPIDDAGFDLQVITHRVAEHTKSRTIANAWLRELGPENVIQVSREDAERLGLATGDLVRAESATNPTGVLDLGNGQTKPMTGRVRVSEGIRPGVIAYSLGHGHWAYGASDIEVDGTLIAGDPARGRGVHLNPVLRTDPKLTNTCLSDLVGGSAVFYDTRVRLVKV